MLRKDIDKELNAEEIKLAQFKWASSIALVLKMDGTLQFCVDYRRLNSTTILDTYPLPRMKYCTERFEEASVCSIWCSIGILASDNQK